ncbi:hypothetical protein [Mesorhizobium sp. M2C.T.Ca.TU.002.02.1.1]|uniref:hypothetical protein n=1 Tax=Mesorhizobium sp. M2C.T.Ca.TU.002.02.1.1 TaxID=2496788 RepID=UPI000FCB9B10|nr:hypothetical protein [Mesorhizobium sp. M2C.T.Ca.TU.002.02.1.1]RUU55358.1 hypothetical protein EOD07_18960 [Mesorhizobium sp. M2C.T.Ca.TU.002.02.1.1]RUU63688.1 hypothetical protein EOD04_22395 [Mesorhizobium sp. M2C.T.Ca.TU.009.01.2.1]
MKGKKSPAGEMPLLAGRRNSGRCRDLDELPPGPSTTPGDLAKVARTLAGGLPADAVSAVARFTKADFGA